MKKFIVVLVFALALLSTSNVYAGIKIIPMLEDDGTYIKPIEDKSFEIEGDLSVRNNLTVYGDSTFQGTIQFGGTDERFESVDGTPYIDLNDNDEDITFGTDAGECFIIMDNGDLTGGGAFFVDHSTRRVAIGTASAPSRTLHVQAGNDNEGMRVTSGDLICAIEIQDPGGVCAVGVQNGTTFLGPTEWLATTNIAVNGSGDLGIHDTTPDASLDVEGDTIISDSLTASTSVFFTSLPSGSTQPAGVHIGELWLDTDDQTVKVGT